MRSKNIFTATVVASVLLLMAASSVGAAVEIEPSSTTLNSRDNFGSSVAVDGNTAMVGAIGDSNFAGKVYVFRNDGGWAESDTITPLGLAANDHFGISIDLFGDIAVIGADQTDIDLFPEDLTNDLIDNAGAAYIMQFDGSDWQEKRVLTAYNAKAKVGYGGSVAVFDRFIIIGSSGSYGDVGAAYIYERPASGWADLLLDEDATQVTPPNPNERDDEFFGASVAISDQFAVVGAFGDDDIAERAGAVYIFEKGTDGSWGSDVKLPTHAANVGSFTFQESGILGISVAIDGNFLVAGAPGITGVVGQVYVFFYDETNGEWSVSDQIQNPDGTSGFGTSVAIKDNYIVVGTDYGPAYIYRQSESDPGTWEIDGTESPFGPDDGNGATSEVDIAIVSGGDYNFLGGVPDRNNYEGGFFIDGAQIDATDSNVAPAIYSVNDQIMRAGGEITLTLPAFDLESQDELVIDPPTFAVESGDLTQGDLSFSPTGLDLTINSDSSNTGTATVTVTVTDVCPDNLDCTSCAADPTGPTCPKTSDPATFQLSVADIPEINITSITPDPPVIDENQLPITINALFEIVSPGSMQRLDVTSSDSAIVPKENISFGFEQSNGNADEYSLEIQLTEPIAGSAKITITAVADNGVEVNEAFLVTVNGIPRISNLPEEITVSVNDSDLVDGLVEIPFAVSDAETYPSELVVDVSEPAGSLAESPSVVPGSSPNARVLQIPWPVGDVGVVDLVLTVSDDRVSSEPSDFKLTVVSTTDTIISSISTTKNDGSTVELLDLASSKRIVSLNQGEVSISLDVQIEDGDTKELADLETTVTSSRTWASNFDFTCDPWENSVFQCSLSIAEPPATADTSLDSTFTIRVDDSDTTTDSDTETFILTYNTPPTIEPAEGETFIEGVTIDEDIDEDSDGRTDIQIFNFTIGDDSTEPDDLTKNITSSNNLFLDLVDTDTAGNYLLETGCADINSYNCWTCNGGDCQIRVKPTLDDHGSAVISAEVTDAGGLSAGMSFNLTVTPVNDPPGLIIKDGSGEVSAVTMAEDSEKTLSIEVSDVDGDPVTVNVESFNTDLIPNDFRNIKICEESGGDLICFDRSDYTISLDASNTTETVKLLLVPEQYANSELLQPDGSVIGPANINVAVIDTGAETVDKNIKVTVTAEPSPPVITFLGASRIEMDDNRDAETAEAESIGMAIHHPDGDKQVNIGIDLISQEPETCTGDDCVIPIDPQNVYLILSDDEVIDSSDEVIDSLTLSNQQIEPGAPLYLGVVLKPEPNRIEETTKEKFEIVVTNSDPEESSLSDSEIITATVKPVNDAPTIIGLRENYPCLDCDVESPWLQEMPQSIDFTVADPDPQDDLTLLDVTAKWGQKDGADIDPTGEYTPVVIEGPTRDGQVSLLVVPPDTGRLPLTVTVTDTKELSSSQEIYINVQEAPPEVEPSPDEFDFSLDTTEDEEVPAEVKVSDIETDDLSLLTILTTWRSVTPDMPEGAVSVGEISSGGLATLMITPPADWPRGADDTAVAEIDVTARQPDGVRSETITFTLTIHADPDEPVLTSAKPLEPAPIISEGGIYIIDFWIEDSDTRIDSLNIEPVVTGLDLRLSALDCPINDPYLKRCELTVTGPEQSFGDSIITITAAETSPPYLEGSLEVPLTVKENNEAPSFSIVGANPFSAFIVDPDTGEKSIATNEDTLVTVTYEISDPDGPTEGLQVVADSLQWIWTASTTPMAPVELALIAQGNSIQITPTQNGFGEGSVLLQVTDGVNTVSAGFDVAVTAKNDPPVVSFTNPPQEPLAESDDNKTIDLELSISDIETDSSAITPTFTVEWVEDNIEETLIAEDHILTTGTGEIRTVKFTRPDICSEDRATAVITVRVTDGDSADPKFDTDQVAIEYTAVDFPPTIRKKNGLYFESIEENSGPYFVDFVVGKEPACRPAELVMTMPVISGDPELLPEGNYYFDPDFTGATRRLWLEPAQNKWGTVDITVSVLDALTPDQLESDPLSFTLRVDPVTHAPTISVLMQGDSPDQVYQVDMDESETTEGMGYVIEVEDLDTPSEELIMGAIWAPVSGREDEFVEGDIRFDGTGVERNVIITPEPYENGYAKITPWVKDSADATPVKSQPFVLHVRPVNDPPVINVPIANPDDKVFVQGDETYILRFQVWDRDSVLPSNSVSAESGNTSLLPQNDLTRFDWGRIENPQDNMTHYLKMRPYPISEEYKEITVTIKASDGAAQSTFPFTLHVVRNANPPQITIRPSVSVWEDPVEAVVVDFKVTDAEKEPQDLDVFVSSGDTRFIPNSSIEVEYIGGVDVNWRLTFRPAADAPFDEGDSYTTPLIISAYNDFFEAVRELIVTIYNRNDAPKIVNINQPETVYLNEPFEIFFEVSDMDEGPDNLELTATSTDLPDAVYEFSPDIGTSRTLKVFPNISSPDQRSIDITITVTDNSGVVSPTNGEESNFAEETVTVYMAGAAPGDVDGSGIVDLGDAVAALQVLSGIEPGVFLGADVDGDGRIGFAEAFNALTHAANQ